MRRCEIKEEYLDKCIFRFRRASRSVSRGRCRIAWFNTGRHFSSSHRAILNSIVWLPILNQLSQFIFLQEFQASWNFVFITGDERIEAEVFLLFFRSRSFFFLHIYTKKQLEKKDLIETRLPQFLQVFFSFGQLFLLSLESDLSSVSSSNFRPGVFWPLQVTSYFGFDLKSENKTFWSREQRSITWSGQKLLITIRVNK